ncbi:MAG: S-layer homology domain-containing protein, partial [Bryobacteraceae bacterium]|nr:S-layer homology domain-containing protein [Bryobacteraceae bacterium]
MRNYDTDSINQAPHFGSVSRVVVHQDGKGQYASVYLDTLSSGVTEKWYDPQKLSDDVSWLFEKNWNDSVLFRAVQHAQKGFNRGSTTLKISYGSIDSAVRTRPLFPDLEDEELKQAVQRLYERSIVTGYPDGTFRPNEKLLRRHAARMIVKELGLKLPEGYQPKATDMKPGDAGYEDMAIAEAYGLLGQD